MDTEFLQNTALAEVISLAIGNAWGKANHAITFCDRVEVSNMRRKVRMKMPVAKFFTRLTRPSQKCAPDVCQAAPEGSNR